MWPAAFWEKLYEPIIRHAAGLGSLSGQADPDVYDKGFLHCDLLVIGAGPSGLMAALTAGRAGRDVILADEDFRMGGRLNSETHSIDDQPGANWAAASVAELASLPNVRLMHRTTVIGAFDHGIYGAVERISDHLFRPDPGKPRQVLWRIYAGQTILCAGATERPIAFDNNDRPGIMLGSAIRTYVNRFAATPARRVTLFTNNDDGHRTARDLQAKGIHICAVVDVRPDAPRSLGLRSAPRRAGHRHQWPSWSHLRRGAAGGWQHAHHRMRRFGGLWRLEPERASDLPPARPPGLERSDRRLRAGRNAATGHARRRGRQWRDVYRRRPSQRYGSGTQGAAVSKGARRACPRPKMPP